MDFAICLVGHDVVPVGKAIVELLGLVLGLFNLVVVILFLSLVFLLDSFALQSLGFLFLGRRLLLAVFVLDVFVFG